MQERRVDAGGMTRAVEEAETRLKGIVSTTPLQSSTRLSERYGANILIKREDMQAVRSFKIRGAYNKIASLSADDRKRPIVCASAGNHAQGVAFACAHLGIGGTVFMPRITPTQKIERVEHFGGEFVEIRLVGDSYDEASTAADTYCQQKQGIFVHPFDDLDTIAGQGTVGKEIYDATGGEVAVVIVPVGGGGLASGVASYIKEQNPAVVVIGAEPAGSPSMYESLKQGRVITLDKMQTFVDGAAVRRAGQRTFDLCRRYVDRVVLVPEGRICTTMVELYQNEGIITEPAGALSLSALEDATEEIRDKTVVCVLSGGNNDILRYPEIMERSLVYQGRKHYFIIEFAQKPGQLRQFVDDALGPTDDIVRFEYIKKTNKERGAALVGIELRDKADLEPLLKRMEQIQLNFRPLGSEELLYQYLV
jgi:threonine dehydratase